MWKSFSHKMLRLSALMVVGLFSAIGPMKLHSNDCHHRINQVLPGNWQPLSNPGVFGLNSTMPACGSQLLLTDGSVLVFNFSVPNLGEVWKLTPDIFGSYVNGTWSQLASLPPGYAPFAFASAVLPDGRVFIAGGEFNGPDYDLVWTSLAAVYDPITNIWTPFGAPTFFNGTIGDAQSVILPNGSFMLANALTKQAAVLNLKTMTWKEVGTTTKWDVNDGEGWTLLPHKKVLTIDSSGVNAPNAIITTNQSGVGPFIAIPATGPFTNNAAPTAPIVGPGAVSTPDDSACTAINDLTGRIGVAYRGTECASSTIVSNMADANALAVIEISDKGAPFSTGGGNGVPFSVMMSTTDGIALVTAINTNPNLVITITQPEASIIPNYAEIFDIKSKKWSSLGSTLVPLSDPVYQELGPAILRPNGTVFCCGGVLGNTAVFNLKKNIWTIGPKFPFVTELGQFGAADTGAALLPNGNVLVSSSLLVSGPLKIFEFNGSKLTEQPTVPNTAVLNSVFMLVLPTGQIMLTDGFTTDVEIYTSGNTHYNKRWAPVIHSVKGTLYTGETYKIEGVRFNGMSQGAMFGDDYQSATNYPLVRITHQRTDKVHYCRTHDHSHMGVASKKKMHTFFDVPHSIEHGKYKLEVVVNGIPSRRRTIHVK